MASDSKNIDANVRHESLRDRLVPKFLMTYDEASRSLGVCERTLRNWIDSGILPAVKIGSRTLFDPSDLEALKHRFKVKKTETG